MNVYIRSSGNISPQNSLEKDSFYLPPLTTDLNYFKSIEPAYDRFVDSKMIRRMSRIVKMGVGAAMTCLENAGVGMPGAILTATAYGCLEDTSSFLRRMIEFDEKLLSPTAFIQSTHNTVGAQIALLLACHEYNNTIVHRSFSFENALTEAKLLLLDGMGPVLAGAIDEITNDRHAILSRFGLYREKEIKTKELATNIAGEGAAFFLLDLKPGQHPQAILKAVSTFHQIENKAAIQQSIAGFLDENNIQPEEIGLVLGSEIPPRIRQKIENTGQKHVLSGIPFFPFKTLCGDYPTATGFALWLASRILHEQKLSPWIPVYKIPIRNILIFNLSENNNLSLLLISAC